MDSRLSGAAKNVTSPRKNNLMFR